ncbi:MAG: D-glycerate dehydrogenase [Candidatus Hydrogenedentes bacterium]|nr:D-glycerate dehydrogenase [Candidatus Hydrogenedentota bacterium]
MPMPRVFVARQIPDAGLKLLYDAFGRDSIVVFPEDRIISRAELIAGVKGVDAVLPILTDKIDGEVLDAAGSQLRIVANFAVGYNNIDVPAATARKVPITNTPGVLTDTTADLTFALILSVARRMGEGERMVRARQWPGWGPMQLMGSDVFGKTLGIFGMGRIGQAVAKRATGFDMKVLYTNRKPLDTALEKQLNARYVDKATLLAESDYLSIHCPLMPETTHAFGAPEFSTMKKSSYLINTSRGPVVDESALVKALKHGDIAGAGLDVYEHEPTLHEGLYDCENAVIAPHLGSATLETRGKMASIAATNIIARLRGERPPNCVNPEVLD